METTGTLNRKFEVIAWGTFFIWWGLTDPDLGLFRSLPHGTGALGIALILLGLNVARALNGIPTGFFTTTLGIILLVLGVVELGVSVLRLPYQVPGLAVVLIVMGLVILAREIQRSLQSINHAAGV